MTTPNGISPVRKGHSREFYVYHLISDRATCWLYSFTPSATAALLPNLPWKERPRELGSFLFGNLLENLPSSTVPGEAETILRVRIACSFPSRGLSYRLLPIVFWTKWMKTDQESTLLLERKCRDVARR